MNVNALAPTPILSTSTPLDVQPSVNIIPVNSFPQPSENSIPIDNSCDNGSQQQQMISDDYHPAVLLNLEQVSRFALLN